MSQRRLTKEEIGEIRRRRAGIRASLACEGMQLSPEAEALFDAMERDGLTSDERARLIDKRFEQRPTSNSS